MRIAAKTVPPKARSTASRVPPRPVKDAAQTPFETAGSSRRRARKPRPKHRSEGPGGAVDLPGRAFGNTRDRLGEARPRRPSGCLGAARSCPAGRLQGRPELGLTDGFQGATGHALNTHRRCRRERPWPITPPKALQSRQERAAGRGGGVTCRTARRGPWRASGGPATRWQATADPAGKVCERRRRRDASLRESENRSVFTLAFGASVGSRLEPQGMAARAAGWRPERAARGRFGATSGPARKPRVGSSSDVRVSHAASGARPTGNVLHATKKRTGARQGGLMSAGGHSSHRPRSILPPADPRAGQRHGAIPFSASRIAGPPTRPSLRPMRAAPSGRLRHRKARCTALVRPRPPSRSRRITEPGPKPLRRPP